MFGIFRFEEDWGVNVSDINGVTGGLTYVSGNGLDFTSALAVHPSGQFLYVTDDDSDYITAYTIDSTTGDLTIIPGSPYGDECAHVTTCDPMGLYTGPYATGSMPESIAVDPSGKFAYVGNKSSNNISAYTIDGSTGILAAVPGSPFAAGMSPASVAIASSSAVPFKNFLVKAAIDEDRKTSFHVEGFFTLGKGSNGIYPLSETVTLQVGSYSVTVPSGSFKERDRFAYIFVGEIDGVDLNIRIYHVIGNDYIFTAEGKGDILSGVTNPVTIGLAIGDDEGSATVKADIDH
jgi:DNA-binding beta-propeller fold protein YncE